MALLLLASQLELGLERQKEGEEPLGEGGRQRMDHAAAPCKKSLLILGADPGTPVAQDVGKSRWCGLKGVLGQSLDSSKCQLKE